jgi:hypothetical protein
MLYLIGPLNKTKNKKQRQTKHVSRNKKVKDSSFPTTQTVEFRSKVLYRMEPENRDKRG